MSITKEIVTKCLHENTQFKGIGLTCVMNQISEMNILQEIVECNKLVSINASTNLIEELEEYFK